MDKGNRREEREGGGGGRRMREGSVCGRREAASHSQCYVLHCKRTHYLLSYPSREMARWRVTEGWRVAVLCWE